MLPLNGEKYGNEFWFNYCYTVYPLTGCHLPGRISMETAILLILILALLVVFTVDIRQNRHKNLARDK